MNNKSTRKRRLSVNTNNNNNNSTNTATSSSDQSSNKTQNNDIQHNKKRLKMDTKLTTLDKFATLTSKINKIENISDLSDGR